jgi:ferredoxin
VRVVVDLDLCEGNARCVESAPEVFELRDDQARLLIEHPGERLRGKVEQAVRLCPRQAISIREDQ